MLALQPQMAQAQAFQGTETVILGNVTRGTSGNTDFFTVNAAQNTINWAPTDTAIGGGPIDFLPAGATASFTSGAGLPYTVLNRIIAADQSRAIAFSGTVSSDALGSIWFYAPGGLLLNAGAQFNVGSLLLTANDPVGAAAGQTYLNANQFQLRAASGSTAGVVVNSGATINTSNYMIMVAPRFDMNGAATVGRSAALVAAEDVSFTLNGGLFDITANVGTTAGGTSQVGGSITGPGGLGGQGIYSRIYAMAVPRNNAMTMLITGGAQLGFAVANAADVDGNAVVLSGGYDIVGTPAGQGVSQFGLLPVAGSNADALVRVENKTITSSLTMRSRNEARVSSTAGALSFASDLEVYSDSLAVVNGDGLSITVAGNLLVDASTQFTGQSAGANRTAGTAQIFTNGTGSVQVSGNILAWANGAGDDASSPGVAGGTGTGGSATVNPNGGSVQATNLSIRADGFGGAAIDGTGGSGIGGTAFFESDALGSVAISGDLVISANGVGIVGSAGRTSGNAQGGTATANITGGTFATSGIVTVSTNAAYAEVGDDGHAGGGTATGGTASLFVNNGAAFTASSVTINAVADGGLTVGNNSFVGGTARLHAQIGGGPVSITVNGDLTIDASALASNGIAGGNTNGGTATGGFAILLGLGNPLLTLGGDGTRVAAEARGGNGDGGVGGNANGGRAHVDMQNGGSLLIGANLDVIADATGGSGTVGGNAVGWDEGDANAPAVFVRLGPNVGVNDQGIRVSGSLFGSAGAFGGDGSTGVGGNATGGFVVLLGQSGTITAPSVSLLADATGGQGVGGGAARSGRLFGGFNDANLTTGQLTLDVDATGGDASNGGRGGNATVGQAFFVLSSLEAGPGSTVNGGSVLMLAAAQGGAGGGATAGTAGAGGDAFGVDPNATEPQLVIASRPARSTFIATQVAIDNSVVGGEGGGGLGTANGGRGGNAVGGVVNVGTTSGPVTPVSNRSSFDFGTIYFVDGRVTGGNGGGIDGDGIGGRGGDATGGSASLLARGAVVTAGAVSILTSASGGNGGGGGNSDFGGGDAVGGEALVLATPHFTAGLPVDVTISGPVTLIASALGGSSHVQGGEGIGGTAAAYLQRHEAAGAAPVTLVGSMSIASLSADAGGVGGAAMGNGARGGDGIGGDVELIAEGGAFDLPGGAQLTAIGRGQSGTTGNTGLSGGDGGAAIGGSASVIVRPGGILTMPFLNVDVSALAGLGGDGGTGQAGTPPGIPLPGQRDGNPGGNGQAGGAGGTGGEALGGNITIGTDAANSGGSITITSLGLRSDALAGVGGGGGIGGAGANGAPGLDGDSININGGNGGAGGNGGQGGNAGAGGNATGGSVLIGATSNDQGTAWSLNVPLISPILTASAGSSGVSGQGGAPGLGGAGGAAGLPPGVAGTPGANGSFGLFGFESFAGFGTGGNLQVLLFNANLTAPGIDLSADADGAFSSNAQAGDAQAGSAELVISGGTTSLGYVRLSAIGQGGDTISGTGGIGRAGSVVFRILDGADVTLGTRIAPVQLVADGYGGDAFDGGLGNSGFAGSILTEVSNANLQVNGDLVMVAEGFTGFDGIFATATGGTLDLRFDDASSLGVSDQLVLIANARGPVANGGQVTVTGVGSGSLTVGGDAQFSASAELISGLPGLPSAGGTVTINTDDGNSFTVAGDLSASASANSFSPMPNAEMLGGSVAVNHRGTTSIGGVLSLDASAIFGDGAGGDATGGDISVTAEAGSFVTGGLSFSASAEGGDVTGGVLTSAFGGAVLLRADAGASFSSIGGSVSLVANGRGFSNNDGPGGDGAAGTVSLGADGTLELDMGGSGTFVAEAIGYGGSSLSGDFAGNGFGGGIDFNVGAVGTLNIVNPITPVIELKANGIGGDGQPQGGEGRGGGIFISSDGGNMATSSLTLNVRGEGGLGTISGNASAGRAEMFVGGGLTSIGGDLLFDGNAVVAGGSVEGDGTGGLLDVDVSAGTLNVAGALTMRADGDGTANIGGTIGVNVGSGLLDVGGSTTLSAVSFNDTANANTVIEAGTVLIDVGAAGELRSAGGMTIDVTGAGSAPAFGVEASAGVVFFQSNGRVQIGGTGLSMFGNAFWTGSGGLGGSAQGGVVELFADDGTFETTSLTMEANAGGGVNPGGIGGFGFGGTVTLSIGDPAVLTLSAPLSIAANGFGGAGDTGGEGIGGDILAVIDNGSINQLGQRLLITANGLGGDGALGPGGDGFGGDIIFGPGDLTVTSTVPVETALEATATGGASSGGVGGFASGGSIDVFPDVLVQGRSLSLPGGLSLRVNATGGVGAAGTGGAEGGNATFDWEIGPVTLAGELLLDASATGIDAIGGSVSAAGDRGPLVATSARFLANATGADGASVGGSAQGGDATIDLFRGATASFSGGVLLSAVATGGVGNAGAGGAATGGSATLDLEAAGTSLTATNLTFNTQGTGGQGIGGAGGIGEGGAALFELRTGAQATITGTLAQRASGTGGAGLIGGQGIGGSTTIITRSGGQLLGNAFVDNLVAGGLGGNGADGDGGRADGGTVLVRAETGGSLALGRMRLVAAGATGGNAAGAGNGGVAQSGTLQISADNGTIDIAGIELFTASAVGGNAAGSGNGGDAFAGSPSVLASNGSSINIVATGGTVGVSLTAAGAGGNAVDGRGGNGLGGTVTVDASGGSQITLDGQAASNIQVSLRARGIGGTGASGGTGTGGQVRAGTSGDAQLSLLGQVELVGEGVGGNASQVLGGNALAGQVTLSMKQAVATTAITAGDITVLAAATAGNGGNGGGLQGRGGSADLALASGVFIGSTNNRGTMTTGTITATVAATGGRGGDGLTTDGGRGGDAIAGGIRIGFLNSDFGGPDAGTITTGIVDANASAVGGDGGAGSSVDGAGGNGGQASAGGVNVFAFGGTLRVAPASTIQPGLIATVSGRGGAGGSGLIGGNGGGGFGGEANMGSFANLQAGGQLGQFESGRQQVSVDGEGGSGAIGGEGRAGGIELRSLEGVSLINGQIGWSATAIGGESFAGIGGLAAGGGFGLLGNITVAGSVLMDAGTAGGNGESGGGEAFGGRIDLRGNLDLQANLDGFITAAGGNALASGAGGRVTGGSAELLAANGEAMRIADFVGIAADVAGGNGASGGDATGASIRLITTQPGSSIDVGGLDILGNAAAGNGGVVPPQGLARAGNASGGTFSVSTDGGSIRVRSDLAIRQSRSGGNFLSGTGNGGSATGGSIGIRAIADPNLGGGLITVDGIFSVVANAAGGNVDPQAQGGGGSANGTNLTLNATAGAAIDLVGGAALTMNANGGSSSSGGGGAGTGARFVTTVNASTVNIGGAGLNVAMDSRGGSGLGGGAAFGGQFDLFVDSGALVIDGNTAIRADSNGGFGAGSNGQGGSGGSAGGADVRLQLTGPDNNSRLQLSSSGSVEINAISRGGTGGGGEGGGAGGAATGGTIELGAIGSTGTIALGNLQASVFAEGGTGGNGLDGGNGGSAQGGFLSVGMAGNTQGPAGDFTMASADLDASARSGNGGSGQQTPGVSGDATAGSVQLAVRGASGSVAGNVDLVADAISLGTARGGVIELSSEGGGSGVGGDFAITGNVVAESRTTGATTQAGAVRVFALDGSRLAMASLESFANGTTPSASPERGGLVADVGSTIAIAGSASVVSPHSLGLNDGGTITAGGLLAVSSGQQVLSSFGTPTPGATGTVTANTLAVAAATGIDLTTNIAGSGDVLMDSANGGVQVGNIEATRNVGLLAPGAISSGALTSGRDLVLLSGGTITTGALATPATGRIRIDDFAQRSLVTFPGGVADYTALFAAAATARAGDTVINGNLTTGLFEARSTGLLRVTGTINAAIGARLGVGSLQIGSTASQGFLDLSAVDSLVLADLDAQGQISLASDGSITAGNVTTGQSLVLAANRPGATLTTGNVRADGEIRLSSNTTLTTGILSSGNRIFLTAGGAILSGAIDAGTVNPQAGASGVLFATSPATIRTGPINVSGSATLSGVLGVTTGNIAAPGGIVLLDTGGIDARNLTTSPSGFVYIAAHDLLPQITFDQAGNPLFAQLLASTPIRLVGDINLGDATTGRFIAAATGNFFVNNATAATSMLVDVGGFATLDFNINTPSLTVTSSDIGIDPLAAVGAAGGSIVFNTTGATTVIVGGASAAAVPGTYRLSNGEFGALRASSITVRSFAAGMTVDQLALPAVAPGQAANPGVTLRTDGTLRVTGAVTMAQAGADNRLNLIAGNRIEVVQGSGSVRLGAGVDTPAGTLAITAPRVWVASDSLLTELAGSTLVGQARIDAVNAAGAPAVVGGSIGAGTILIGADREVLIQNSGTDQLKAGFTAGSGGLRIRRAFEGNNPMEVVINGRIQRADNSFAVNADTLSLVQLDPGISLVTAGSTVNGCIITTATCPGLLLDELFQPVVTIINNVEELTPEQEEQREAAQEAAEKLPIVLLQRLIDFSPLFVDPDATDPVTSGGNPALWMDPMPRGVRTPGGLN